jgi:hypothetical protein
MNEIEADLADAMPLDVVEEESGEAEVLKVFQKGVNPGDKKEGLFAGCVIRRFDWTLMFSLLKFTSGAAFLQTPK